MSRLQRGVATSHRIHRCIRLPVVWAGATAYRPGGRPNRGGWTQRVRQDRTAPVLRKNLRTVTHAQRTLQRSDFHLPKDVAPDDRTTRELFIDVVLALPELKKGSGDRRDRRAHLQAPANRRAKENSDVPHAPRRSVAGRRNSRRRSHSGTLLGGPSQGEGRGRR